MISNKEFTAAVNKHRNSLYKRIYYLLNNAEDAEDCLQDSLANAYIGLPNFKGECSLHTWLYTIVTNTAITYRRRRVYHYSLIEGWDTKTNETHYVPERVLERKELQEAVASNINNLEDPRARYMMNERVYNKTPYKVLAKRFNMELTCVKSILYKGRRCLAHKMKHMNNMLN